jgi:hypothetical protein
LREEIGKRREREEKTEREDKEQEKKRVEIKKELRELGMRKISKTSAVV